MVRSAVIQTMLLSLLFCAAPLLQGDEVFARARFEPASAPIGSEVALIVTLDMAPGWHVYHPDQNPDDGMPVSVAVPEGFLAAGSLISLADPEPHSMQMGSKTIEYLWLSGTAELSLPLTVGEGSLGEATVTVVPRVQVCDDSFCLPPNEMPISATFERLEGNLASLWAFLLAAVAGGIFALLMPCTYPMIPITISFFTKQAEARGGKVLPLSLAYGFGIIGIFVLISVLVGPVILTFATHPVTNLIIGGLFLVFALALFGLINLNPPQALMRVAGSASSQGGFVGVFLMGATLVVSSFTCTAPFVGSLLSLGAAGGDGGGIGKVALGMAVFGLTMAIPFVFLSLAPGRIQKLPQSGAWMERLKVTLGFVEVAAALKFISNADVIWRQLDGSVMGIEWGFLSRERFLLLWAVIFIAAAIYLLGFLPGKRLPRAGGGRLISAIGLTAFAGYCGYGYQGGKMDTIMTAIIPNYSIGGHVESLHAVVVDDLDAAREQASASGKLLFLNFTGHT